jgi:hypothetical protein
MPKQKPPRKKVEFVALQVWPATRTIARTLARQRRQSIAVIVDDLLRAALAAGIVTADEGQYAHHGE